MASNSIIQYDSSCSRDLIRRYDVFVSFRGDTRNNFTDHLFGALHSRGISFFRDDTKLKKGKHILPELLQAIDGSQILVVVFSKKYASSKWCLRELEKIADCVKISDKHVLPIFYNVTPSEVRNQVGNYKEAFDEYEKRFKEDRERMEEVQRWRHALSLVGHLSGWNIGNKPQYGEIQKIVQNIQKLLQQNIVCSSNDDLVGIEYPVQELKNLLLLDSTDVVMSLGVCGMAGMGKTTLVTILCERISNYFEFHYFIDASKICQNSSLYALRKHLLGQDLEENSLEIHNVFPRTNLISHGRRLIVLDNVGHIEQLDELNLNHKCLSSGSRIIIISQDRRILEYYSINPIYHVQRLNDDNANQLFCKYAFKVNGVMSEYEMLKNDVLSYLEGHPLLVKVLGRHLVDQDISHWRNALVKLRENPRKDILNKLRISFDGLEKNEQEIFLDIACFYYWYNFNNPIEVLQFRGFEYESGLETLWKKSLITYFCKTWVEMPRLLIDLGKYIVKEKSPKEPRKWSRLWNHQDLHKVLLDNKVPKNLEAIIVKGSDPYHPIPKVDALSKMSQLKLLILDGMKFQGNLNDLSNELGYLIWNEYPSKCLPPNFQPNNLVKLVMQASKMKQLWKGTKALPNLKCLDLSESKNLIKMPNFEEAPNLEWLNFEGCIQLRKVHPSIDSLRKLTCLNLEDCKNLESLPTSLLGLSSLEYLNTSGCSKLFNTRLLEEAKDAKHFNKHWIGKAPIHPHSFPYMRHLNLSFCNLRQIPDAIENLCCLESLNLRGNKFEKMPSLKKLWKLKHINLEHCKKLKYLFELPSQTNLVSEMDEIGEEYKGLCMFNCPKFVKCEEWSRMSISWMVQMVKANHRLCKSVFHQSYVFLALFSIESVIPGNKIPRWFNNQHVGIGSSISVDAAPLNNCIGIAFCVVFSVLKRNLPNTTTKLNAHFLPIDLDVDLVTDKSDHMYLFYFDQSLIRVSSGWWSINSDEIGVYFKTRVSPYGIAERDIEVKKYGYRWVYESDLHL